MFSSTTPLVPDDQVHEREFIPRDLDQEHDSRRSPEKARRRVASERPPVAKRIIRSLARFCATVLIGVGLTLGWQSHGEEAKEIAMAYVPSLAWLLPAASTNKPLETTISPEVMQQMKLIAVDVAIVRRSLGQIAANQEQLAVKQDQLNQNLLGLEQIEQEIRAQNLSPPPAKTIQQTVQPRARNLPQAPAQAAPR